MRHVACEDHDNYYAFWTAVSELHITSMPNQENWERDDMKAME